MDLFIYLFIFLNCASNLDLHYVFSELELTLFLLTLKLSCVTNALLLNTTTLQRHWVPVILQWWYSNNLCIGMMVEVFFAGAGKQVSRLYHLHLLFWKDPNRFGTVLLDALQEKSLCTKHILYPPPGLYKLFI